MFKLVLLFSVVAWASGRSVIREERSANGMDIRSQLVGLPGMNMGRRDSGAAGQGTGGVAGVGAGVNGELAQQCKTQQAQCASAACSTSNNQSNNQSGGGLLAGIGGLLGNTNVSPNVCPPICAQCINANLINAG